MSKFINKSGNLHELKNFKIQMQSLIDTLKVVTKCGYPRWFSEIIKEELFLCI